MKNSTVLLLFFMFTNISFAQNAPLEGTEEGVKLNSRSVMKSPLYIVDGVTVEPVFWGNQIKSKYISEIKILKEKAATSVYGISGENGVVVITLKKKYAKKFKKMIEKKK